MEYIYVFPYSLFSSERSTVKTNKEHDLPVAEWRREHSEGSFIFYRAHPVWNLKIQRKRHSLILICRGLHHVRISLVVTKWLLMLGKHCKGCKTPDWIAMNIKNRYRRFRRGAPPEENYQKYCVWVWRPSSAQTLQLLCHEIKACAAAAEPIILVVKETSLNHEHGRKGSTRDGCKLREELSKGALCN